MCNNRFDMWVSVFSLQVLQMAPGLTELEVVPFKVAAYNKSLSKMDYYNEEKKDDYELISG